MESHKGIKKVVLIAILALFLLGAVFVYQSFRFNDGKLHIVFCNVGQGDGIFIKTPKGVNMVIDGGPDDKILGCLASNMPFWERKIELIFLTHPHADHFIGLLDILKRYTTASFVTEDLKNKTAEYQELKRLINQKGIRQQYVYSGDIFRIADGVSLRILSPSKEFLKRTSPNGMIGEGEEFASLAIQLSYGSFNVIFTGDSQTRALSDSISGLDQSISLLQIPHHGSKTGINQFIVDQLNPKIAVISVGKNRYGHPTQQVLEILKDKDIKILRTDQNGSVEIVSDGKGFEVIK